MPKHMPFRDRHALSIQLRAKWPHLQKNPEDFYNTFRDCCHSLNITPPSERTMRRMISEFEFPPLPATSRRYSAEGLKVVRENVAKARAVRTQNLAARSEPQPPCQPDFQPLPHPDIMAHFRALETGLTQQNCILERIACALEAIATTPRPSPDTPS